MGYLCVTLVNFSEIRLIFNIFYCFWVFVNKHFNISHLRIPQKLIRSIIWNLRHIMFLWRRSCRKIFKSALVCLWVYLCQLSKWCHFFTIFGRCIFFLQWAVLVSLIFDFNLFRISLNFSILHLENDMLECASCSVFFVNQLYQIVSSMEQVTV